MKKLFTLLITLLSFTFVVNAIEEGKLEELKFSEDVGITAIAFDDNGQILALGNEYNCTKEGYTDKTCNVYIIDYDGKVQKYNMYYDNTDNDFPGYTYPKVTLEGSKLRLQTVYKSMIPSKSDSLVEAAVVRYAHEDKTFNFLYCSPDIKEKIDICIVGVTDGGYGIIDSTGKFIVEPSTNYSKAFDDYTDKLPMLKDNNNNLIIATANGKAETIEKSFLDEKGFSANLIEISNYDKDTNYYSYTGTPCPEDQTCAQVISDTIFTKNKVLTSSIQNGGYSTKLVLVNNTPYMVKTWQLDGLFTSDSISDLEGNPLIASMDETSYGHELLSYNRSNKFYVTDMKKNIVEKDLDENIDGIRLLDESNNVYIYQEYKNVTVLGDEWQPKYYILKYVVAEEEPEKKEEEKPITKPIEDKPKEEEKETKKEKTSTKYMCKRVDGVFYDKDGNKVTKAEYEKSCVEPVPDTGYTTPMITISLLAGSLIILRKKNIINKI